MGRDRQRGAIGGGPVPQSRKPGAPSGSPLPLRPLTFGELLDAAVSLLRGHAGVYLTVAIALSATEQAVLYPLKIAAGIRPPWGLPYLDRLGEYWLLLGTGLGTEAGIIALLGGLTARAAGPALLGERIAAADLLVRRGSRPLAVVVTAVVVGAVTALSGFAGLLPWIFAYGLLGLAVPALVIDRVGVGRALPRSLSLSARAGMRAMWVRLGGYLAWFLIRLAVIAGGLAALNLALHPRVVGVAGVVVAAAVNGVAYATLACLDAVLHLETRMRVEGLDITLGRTVRRGTASPATLAVQRGPR
jgi:hypothetical protein